MSQNFRARFPIPELMDTSMATLYEFYRIAYERQEHEKEQAAIEARNQQIAAEKERREALRPHRPFSPGRKPPPQVQQEERIANSMPPSINGDDLLELIEEGF